MHLLALFMPQRKDIETLIDIQLLVDSFYQKVRKDELLGPIFEGKIKGNWIPHLEKMYNFWETILLNVRKYSGSPFAAHAKLPVEKEHFDRWLSLFNQTVDENFFGNTASEAKHRAENMGKMFHYKIQYYREKGTEGLA